MDFPHIKPYLKEVEELIHDDLAKEDERIYGMLVPFIMKGGKRIRPALAILACGATGGGYQSVVKPAAIIELFHNFTLIHDDIEDDSQFRRGEPTLHISHGVPMALNSGDALYTFIWKKLLALDLDPKSLLELQNIYVDSFKRVVDGQGMEIHWIKSGKIDVSEKEYLGMIGGKTSALMGLSCEVGAFMGNEKYRPVLRDYGEKIGAAFQIHDDVLNVTGEFEKYKKEIGGDISEGKRTLMVVHCLQKADAANRKKLISILSKHTKERNEIDEAISILSDTGSIDYARAYSSRLIDEAKEKIKMLPDSRDKESLLKIADYVIRRDL
jgi:geranylgeranyl diphosphate synthase type I